MNLLLACTVVVSSLCAADQPHYYAHDTALDQYGVIAPWYTGQNGQFDLRVRVAAETMKRYPWVTPPESVAPAPAYMFNGAWSIDSAGVIATRPLRDWDNGDFGQRAAYVLSGLVDYYRYSGDPAAIAHITLMGNLLLDQCLTPADHPWPGFLISVPIKGKPYGACDPTGMIQLDIVAETGLGLLYAYEMTGEIRWLDACKHWADLLAEKRDRTPGMPPWNRYANPESSRWDDRQTGGVVFILRFFDELLRLGYAGTNDSIRDARSAGLAYLRDELLPRWHVDDTWGRNYWDWWDSVQAENVTEFTVRYLVSHPDDFPNWRSDARNVLTLFLNRTSVASESGGDMYSGAWAFPESSGCCGRSLSYGPQELATVFAEYGARANNPWAREIGRRQQILATYDFHENGVVEDNIDGQFVVASAWFKIAHPMALKHALGTMAWLPEVEGANRENHLMRTSSIVTHVVYGDGNVAYETFDAASPAVDVVRLSYHPDAITANDAPLARFDALVANGYSVLDLPGGDCVVTIRHDGANRIKITGNDPQQVAESMVASGQSVPSQTEARFNGNQVRLVGTVGPDGGIADVLIDGQKQLVPMDFWNPKTIQQQVVYYTSGLSNTDHTITIVPRAAGNPVSTGNAVRIETILYSAATGESGFGAGGGTTDTQRMIFGRVARPDFVDAGGNAWRPATEWVSRSQSMVDIVQRSWWTERRRLYIANTAEPELYRYGAHAPEFWVNLTVAPGTYHVRLKFAETRDLEPKLRAVTVLVNGEARINDMDVAATAGGLNTAVDVVLNDTQTKNGGIEVRLRNDHGGEAMLQALELGSGPGGDAATPVKAVIAEEAKPKHAQ